MKNSLIKEVIKNIFIKSVNESTDSFDRGSYVGPLVPGTRLFDKSQLAPFINQVSNFDDAELAVDSYDGKLDVSKKTANKMEKKARKTSKFLKKHPEITNSDDDGNNINQTPGKKLEIVPVNEDLGVWFGTKKKPKGSKQPKGPWVNICRKKEGGGHPPCGRPEADSKGYPKCRAAGVASKMTDAQKKSACSQKRRAEKTKPKTGTGNKPTMVSYKPKKKKSQNESVIKQLILKSLRSK
jgi:hypothetical protein